MVLTTKYLTTNDEDLVVAGEMLSNGQIVAFPTETVYGLGANALSSNAVEKIFVAKGRPSDNPLIVHIADIEELTKITNMQDSEDEKIVKEITNKFWPGPLTLVLPKRDIVPSITTGGLDTVAVRMPKSKVALDIIKNSKVPISAPSANLSGRPSPTLWKHVKEDMNGRIDGIVQGEPCDVGIESTVIEVKNGQITILRPGIITAEDIGEVLSKNNKTVQIKYDKGILRDISKNDSGEKPKSPGMKYKHYAPKGKMIIVKGETEKVEEKIKGLQKEYEAKGENVGVLNFSNIDEKKVATLVFKELRRMDEEEKNIILVSSVDENTGIGMAIMNRMIKAAGGNIINA